MNEIVRGLSAMGVFIGGIFGLNELLHFMSWTRRKQAIYEAAFKRARVLGKPFLVIGRPTSIYGAHAHDCGDVCVDIEGCPECPGGIKGDIRDLSQFKAGQFGTVYVGHVFEELPAADVPKAFAEITRVADEAFVAYLPDKSISSKLCPRVRTVVHTAPPRTPYIEYTDIVTGIRGRANPTV